MLDKLAHFHCIRSLWIKCAVNQRSRSL